MKDRTPGGGRRRTPTTQHESSSHGADHGGPAGGAPRRSRKRRSGPLPDVEVSIVASEVDSGVVETRPDGSVVVRRTTPVDPQAAATRLNVPAVARDAPTVETAVPAQPVAAQGNADVDPAAAWFAEGASGATREGDGVASIPGAEDALGITLARQNRKRLAKIGLFMAAAAAAIALAAWEQRPPASPDTPRPSPDLTVRAEPQRWAIRGHAPRVDTASVASNAEGTRDELAVAAAVPAPAPTRDEPIVAAAIEAPAPIPEGGEPTGPTVVPTWEEVARTVPEAAPAEPADDGHEAVAAAAMPVEAVVAAAAAPDEAIEPAGAAAPATDEAASEADAEPVPARVDPVVAAGDDADQERVADEDDRGAPTAAVAPEAPEAPAEPVTLWPDGFPADSIPAQVAAAMATDEAADLADTSDAPTQEDAPPQEDAQAAPPGDELDEGAQAATTELAAPAADRHRSNPSSAQEWFDAGERLAARAPKQALYAYGRAATRGYAPAYKAMARMNARLGDRLGTLTAYRRYLAVRPWADDAAEVQQKILALLDP